MEVDVHLLPTNLLQAMDHLLCSRISVHNSFKKRANPMYKHGVQNSYLPSIIWWYSSVFSVFGVRCAASLALAALEGKWGHPDDTGEQYSTFTMCLQPSSERCEGCRQRKCKVYSNAIQFSVTSKLSMESIMEILLPLQDPFLSSMKMFASRPCLG